MHTIPRTQPLARAYAAAHLRALRRGLPTHMLRAGLGAACVIGLAYAVARHTGYAH